MWINLLATAFCLVCVLMMLVILIQKPRGGGLAGAFGGAGGGSSQAVFGAKTGDVLTWITVAFFVMFLLLAMGLTWAIHPDLKDPSENAGFVEGAVQQTPPDDPDDGGPPTDDGPLEAVPGEVSDGQGDIFDQLPDTFEEPPAPAEPSARPTPSTSTPSADPSADGITLDPSTEPRHAVEPEEPTTPDLSEGSIDDVVAPADSVPPPDDDGQ